MFQVWREGAQVQGISQVEEGKGDEREKSSTYSNAIKGTAKGVEEKSGIHPMTEGIRALWGRHT